jgi:hypothetical protein
LPEAREQSASSEHARKAVSTYARLRICVLQRRIIDTHLFGNLSMRLENYMTKQQLVLTLAAAAAAIVLLVVPGVNAQGPPDENSKIQQGYAIIATSGITLNLQGKNRALVGLGSYLVNATADCNGCHGNPTWAPGGDPFAGEPAMLSANGYLVGGNLDIFGPVFVPRNLTPNAAGRPAGMTLEQFIHTIRTGQDRRATGPPPDSNLLQIMPWPMFRNMTDHDLEAIYEFLRSIPCLEGNRPGRCTP